MDEIWSRDVLKIPCFPHKPKRGGEISKTQIVCVRFEAALGDFSTNEPQKTKTKHVRNEILGCLIGILIMVYEIIPT